MRGVRLTWLAAVLAFVLIGLQVNAARADSRFWLGARADYFGGTSDVHSEFANNWGFGLELGVNLSFFSMFAEAVFMGDKQYLLDFNIGVQFFPVDSVVRLGIGVFTGPLLFFFPEHESATNLDFSRLTSSEQQALLSATGFSSLSALSASFDVYGSQVDDLSRFAFGWNLVRGRLSFDVPLGPLYFGVAGQIAYHYFISGDDVAAGAVNEAITNFAREYNLPSVVTNSIREVAGAQPVDKASLNGFNWDVNFYVILEF